jgi:valyl-tRNA synthetase
VNESLAAYRFDEAANAIYDFFWGEFCDWYIELIKPRLAPECREHARIACTNLVTLFEASLRLLHPIMPFITDEIWHAIYDNRPPKKSAALANYPLPDEKQIESAVETRMAILQDVIVAIRNLRAEQKVETKEKVDVQVFAQDPEIRKLIESNQGAIERLANVGGIDFQDDSLEQWAGVRHTARFDVRLVYERQVDMAAEREKVQKELAKLEKERANGERQLGNEQFLAKAPDQVVEKLRSRVEELKGLIQTLRRKLEELTGA